MAHQNAAALAELESAIDAGADDARRPPPSSSGSWRGRTSSSGRDAEAVRWGRRALDARRGARDRRRSLSTRSSPSAPGVTGPATRRGGLADLRAAVDEARAEGLQTRGAPRAQQPRLARGRRRSTPDPRGRPRRRRLAKRIGMLDWAVQMAELGCLAAIETGDWDWALATHARFDEQPISAAYRIDLAGERRDHPASCAARQTRWRRSMALGPLDPPTDPQDAAALDHARAWRGSSPAITQEAAALAGTIAAWRSAAERFRAIVLRPAHERGQVPPTSCGSALDDLDGLHVAGRAAAAARRPSPAGMAALDGSRRSRAGCTPRRPRRGVRSTCRSTSRSACWSEHRFADGDDPRRGLRRRHRRARGARPRATHRRGGGDRADARSSDRRP